MFINDTSIPNPHLPHPISTRIISCQKGLDVASIKRKSGWDILCVFPIRSLD